MNEPEWIVYEHEPEDETVYERWVNEVGLVTPAFIAIAKKDPRCSCSKGAKCAYCLGLTGGKR
jgi:hypothetical protein